MIIADLCAFGKAATYLPPADFRSRLLFGRADRLIEEGTHAGLLARGGHYAGLYNTYFRHQSLEYIEELQSLIV